MAGLVPAIYALLHISYREKDVDARHKVGHDGFLRDHIMAETAVCPPEYRS